MWRPGLSGAVVLMGMLLLPVAATSASTSERTVSRVPQSEDGPWYAAEHQVSLATAYEHLHLQDLAGDLDASLRESGDDRFGGMWIDHGDTFTLYIARTDETFVAPNVPAELSEHLSYVPAEFTERELESYEEVVAEQLNSEGIVFASSVDVIGNSIDVTVGEVDIVEPAAQAVDSASRGTKTPDVVVAAGDLPKADATFYGGLFLSTCTAGFSVQSTVNSNVGVSTAAHCANAQSRSGVSLP